MKNKLICIVILFLITSLTIPPPIDSIEQKTIYSIDLYLLAIREDGGGIVIPVTMNVHYPGYGEVSVIARNGYVAEDTETSIEYALRLASILVGIDYRLYNYEFIFPSNTKLRGPSATLAFLIALLSFFKNATTTDKIGITGVVAPNLIVGLVEGLEDKYEAGLTYGLDKIIGPPTRNLTSATKYSQTIDVLSAYRSYTGGKLYSIDEPDEELFKDQLVKLHSSLSTVFKFSYNSLYRMTNDLIKEIMREGFIGYNKSFGYKLYRLARKHAVKGEWYTASTYIFRSYIETYIYLIESLLEKDHHRALRMIDDVYRTLSHRLNIVHEKILNISNRVHDIWDLDGLINAYVRYLIALELYRRGSITGNFLEKGEFYVISLARTYTVEHWLMLVDNKTVNGKPLSTFSFEVADNVLEDILNYVVKYLYILKILDEKEQKYYLSIISSASGNPFQRFINYTLTYFELCYITQLVYPPIFSQFIDKGLIKELNSTVYSITLRLYEGSRIVPPSSLTTMELARNYIRDKEPLNLTGILYANLLSTLLPLLLLIHSQNFRSHVSPLIFTKTVTTTIETPVEAEFIIAVLVIAIGAFMFGYAIGRVERV